MQAGLPLRSVAIPADAEADHPGSADHTGITSPAALDEAGAHRRDAVQGWGLMIINHRRILHLFTINANFSSKDRLYAGAIAAIIGIHRASLSALDASSAHRRQSACESTR